MRIRGVYIGAMRGATAYEIQVHRLYIRITHLVGGYWTRRHFWRRVSVRIVSKDQA